MNTRGFAYTLNKILSEEIPIIKFQVLTDNFHTDAKPVYGIYVILPDALNRAFNKRSCYIGIDDLGGKVEVYARCGNRGYRNFGRVNDPQQVLQPIEEYINDVFEDVLNRIEDKDFFFSQELYDFFKYNNIPSRTYREKQPHLILDNPEYPIFYTIDFSEYNGDVLLVLERWVPNKDELDTGEFFEGDQTELYRSTLTEDNQKKVFSEILALLRKEGFKKVL